MSSTLEAIDSQSQVRRRSERIAKKCFSKFTNTSNCPIELLSEEDEQISDNDAGLDIEDTSFVEDLNIMNTLKECYSHGKCKLKLLYADYVKCNGMTVDRTVSPIEFWNLNRLQKRETLEISSGEFSKGKLIGMSVSIVREKKKESNEYTTINTNNKSLVGDQYQLSEEGEKRGKEFGCTEIIKK
ncbi:hypothetical protein L1987_57987 [Smallanthus sonchifolius]|uniref:Uncharacterized protein n=1 Tax=Smallanthus sonchifolius TaxID=185202 RepID=A0ACB9DEJ1_9ASTR|nr:hypothetical protein L1987_57987 [Smallanthus sonchifolius]